MGRVGGVREGRWETPGADEVGVLEVPSLRSCRVETVSAY